MAWRENAHITNLSVIKQTIGRTGMKKNHVTTVPEFAIWVQSNLTSGTQDIMKIDFTQTVAVTSGYIKGIRCTMNSNVTTPGSFNAIKGIIDYKTAGYAHGDCAPMASELILNTGDHTRGSYTCLEAQIQAGAGTTWSGGPCSFIRVKLNGTKTNFDANGYLFDIQGFTEGSNLFVDNDGDPAATGGIRCLLGTTPIWLLYRDSAPA